MLSCPPTLPSTHRAEGTAKVMSESSLRWLGIAVAVGVLSLVSQAAQAQLRNSYEGPETCWKLSDHDCTLRVLQHQRAFGQAHSGQTSEHLQFYAGAGTYVHFVSPLPASRIIDELTVSLWVKANRPGLQLAMRVVLPRSKDPRTGHALTTLIRGNSSQQADTWEKLTIQLPFKQLTRQVPLLRSEFGSDVDPGQAYADMLVLNAFGGTGHSDVWLDDLEVSGQVESSLVDADQRGAGSPERTYQPDELSTSRIRRRPTGKDPCLSWTIARNWCAPSTPMASHSPGSSHSVSTPRYSPHLRLPSSFGKRKRVVSG